MPGRDGSLFPPATSLTRRDAVADEPQRPGNVRELRNVLERGAVVATGNILQATDLGLQPAAADAPQGKGGPLSLEELERRHITDVLNQTGGNVSQAARILGVDRVTLYNKMRKYQLKKESEA